MKAYRAEQAKCATFGYVDMRDLLDFKHGASKALCVVQQPGSKQTIVKIIVCKNRKKL